MTGPPAKINVADQRPSRGPRYRYPEEATKLIENMLQDMEDRKIVEVNVCVPVTHRLS